MKPAVTQTREALAHTERVKDHSPLALKPFDYRLNQRPVSAFVPRRAKQGQLFTVFSGLAIFVPVWDCSGLATFIRFNPDQGWSAQGVGSHRAPHPDTVVERDHLSDSGCQRAGVTGGVVLHESNGWTVCHHIDISVHIHSRGLVGGGGDRVDDRQCPEPGSGDDESLEYLALRGNQIPIFRLAKRCTMNPPTTKCSEAKDDVADMFFK